MHEILASLIGLPLGIWVYLLLCRGRFWLERPADLAWAKERDWPDVAVIIPARDEASVVGGAIKGILQQDYPGRLIAILVDDGSSDGTADAAQAAAQAIGEGHRLIVLKARPLPKGWTGKLWAVRHGIERAKRALPGAEYLWLTDADIEHRPSVLRGLVALALDRGVVLASLMARLRMETLAERALIPAYVYFFQMLYPFAWINDPKRPTAGAAGGCMLVNAQSLAAVGGIEYIRGQLIDDCALGRALKSRGPIWLGLAAHSRSLRGYDNWSSVWRLIARSAFTQLRHSALLLLVCIIGMAATFLAPPLLTLSADPVIRAFGLMSWAAMTLSFIPTLRYFGASIVWAPLLPGVALFYLAATIDSARRYWLGRGGEWKGRWQARETT